MDTQLLDYEILQNAAEACKREIGIEIKIKHTVRAKPKANAIIVIHYEGKKIILGARIKDRITTVNALLPLVKAKNEPEKFICKTGYYRTVMGAMIAV